MAKLVRNLEGKVALITGSAEGIGKAYANILLENKVKVCLSDINDNVAKETEKEFRNKFGEQNVIFHKCDVVKDAELEGLFKKTINKLGRLDIVVNNAGIIREDQFKKMLDTNVYACVQGTKLGIKYMGTDSGGKGGVVVNTSSAAGLIAWEMAPGYVATKHAVLGFSRAIGAISPSAHGVRVGVVCPTFVDTQMVRFQPEELAKGQLYGPDIGARLQAAMSEAGPAGEGLVTIRQVAEGFLELVKSDISGEAMVVCPRGSGLAVNMPEHIDKVFDLFVPVKLNQDTPL